MPSGNNAWTASCDTTEDQNGSITVYAICQWRYLSLANHDVTTFPRQVSSVSTAIKVVFVIEAAFHNSIGIIGCNWPRKIIRLPPVRIFCITDTPGTLAGRKTRWQWDLLSICYFSCQNSATWCPSPRTGLARRPVPIRCVENFRFL